MSDYQLSYGIIAQLLHPITDRYELEEVINVLAEDSNLQLNYEGTLIYSDHSNGDQIDHSNGDEIDQLIIASDKYIQSFHLQIQQFSIQVIPPLEFYSCVWYNGSDSPMSMITRRKFLQNLV